jgi:hypothetical protein
VRKAWSTLTREIREPLPALEGKEAEVEAEFLKRLEQLAAPQPGERCPTCNRRVNKPRQNDSPDTREMRIKLPADRMEAAEFAFDGLQEISGIDPYSYPRGVLLEALLLLGGQHREELKEFFQTRPAFSQATNERREP